MVFYSIIVPVYNVKEYLKKCLNSIVNQSYGNWELILIDDGSTDGESSRICDEYAMMDSRIMVYHRKNEGSLMARRYGISQARGDYFLFFDSDDYIHKDLLSIVNNIIEKTKSDLVMYRFRMVGGLKEGNSPVVFKEGTVVGEDGLSKEVVWQKIVGSSELNNLCLKVVKRENIDIETDYSPYAFFRSGTDLLQCLPILANAKKMYFSEEVLYYYQFNPNGISFSKRNKTDRKSIESQLKSWSMIQNEKLKYLSKLNYASDENLKIYYKFCFESLMGMLIFWMASETNNENRKWLIQEIIKNEIIAKAKKYVKVEDINRKYRLIYQLFLNESDKIKVPLTIMAMESRVLARLRSCVAKFKQINKQRKGIE